ncbi:MAG: IucA/IucC family siderophore biosynthesis protein [Acidimicrobiia bacterium]
MPEPTDPTASLDATTAAWREVLTAERWDRANRELTAKIMTELMFEEILDPARVEDPDGTTATFALTLPDGSDLSFRGRRRFLGHWRVDPGSLVLRVDGAEAPLPDVVDLVALAAPALGAHPSTTAGTIGELSNTLLGDVWSLARGRPAAELVDLDPLLVEGEMRGHPWIVANKGRVGFGAADLLAHAPESQRPVALPWLALDPAVADVATLDGLDHATVAAEQLGDEGVADLRARAAAGGLDPATAVLVPVHPWQWDNRILPLHAADVARGRIVPLGPGPARYLPQQSIRTFVDVDRPDRRYVKLPVSILNTSVYRGLPRARAMAAPALTAWFTSMTGADPFLAECGLVLLGEVASVSVAHPAMAAVPDVPYQHTEMLGCIWRESVEGHLRPGERALTMAALLHRDPDGVSLTELLVARSGLSVDEWVERLHRATLPPLLHVLYRYGAAFSPHAQNCLVVLRDGAVERLVVKDFVDDVMVSCEALPELDGMPAGVRAVFDGGLESMLLVQWIQGGLLVCVHRYLSELLEDRLGYPESAFWAAAERVVRAYQDRFAAELDGRFALFDLDAPAFVKLCLNRVRLLERGYADAAERPIASAVGFIDNPLAPRDEVLS